jgi:hypothetical protein
MRTPVEWLESQFDKAKQEKEKAEQRFKEAEELVMTARKRYEACSEMLQVAKREQEAEVKATVVQQGGRGGTRPKVSMPDHMAMLLKEHGPMNTAEIYLLLKEQGWEKTSKNSVNTQLSRHKATRFNKREDGKWFLIETAEQGGAIAV